MCLCIIPCSGPVKMYFRSYGSAAVAFSSLFWLAECARQPYDVRKIIDAFRTPHDDLTILCAHRGLR